MSSLQIAAQPDHSFSAGFKAGFPLTTIGSPVVEDPTATYLGGKLTGNVSGVIGGGIPALGAYQVYHWSSEAPRSSVKRAARYASLGIMAAAGGVAALGVLGAVGTVLDFTSSVGLSS